MKKIIIAAAAVSMGATPAFAASTDTQDVVVNAAVQPECSMENPADINLGNLSINQDAGPDALKLNAVASSPVQNIWVSCNYVTQIKIESANRGLVTSTPVHDTDQFTNKIFYGVQFEPSTAHPDAFVGSDSNKFRVQPNPRTFVQTKEFHDQARLSVTLEALNVNNKRPVAGDYTDTITFTLGTV